MEDKKYKGPLLQFNRIWREKPWWGRYLLLQYVSFDSLRVKYYQWFWFKSTATNTANWLSFAEPELPLVVSLIGREKIFDWPGSGNQLPQEEEKTNA